MGVSYDIHFMVIEVGIIMIAIVNTATMNISMTGKEIEVDYIEILMIIDVNRFV